MAEIESLEQFSRALATVVVGMVSIVGAGFATVPMAHKATCWLGRYLYPVSNQHSFVDPDDRDWFIPYVGLRINEEKYKSLSTTRKICCFAAMLFTGTVTGAFVGGLITGTVALAVAGGPFAISIPIFAMGVSICSVVGAVTGAFHDPGFFQKVYNAFTDWRLR
ncbi:MAG: hypothetical protein P4L16_07260 [Chlamydiales bacterium]|nr:hypothetical protein [Chlamydiales bacterium]